MGQQPVSGMPAVPARPTLVINKVREPVRQVLNQERASDIGLEIVAADDFGDLGVTPDEAEITLREGLVRRIQRESKAADARTWAFARAVQAGRGYYLVMTRFLPGKTWDQEVYVHRIYNQAGVLLDPTHEQPDGSDADWGFIGTWVPWDRYKTEYDTEDRLFSEYSEDDFIAMTEEYPDWYQAQPSDAGKNGQKAVRVVDYWYTERSRRTLAILGDGSTAWANELPEGAEAVDTREVVIKAIKFCRIGGGVQELEQTDWPSEDMPIIKILGEELQPYDDERRAEGMVRPSRDAQMGWNYQISKFVESVGLSQIPRDRLDPEGIDGYEAWWNVANTRTLPYLPYRTYDDQGREITPPQPAVADPNIIAVAQGVKIFDEAIKSTTAVPDPTLGNVDPTLKSGRAIRETVMNAQLSTSNFMDNLQRSLRREGEVINNLLYPIYGIRPGRLVRVLTGEGESQQMAVGDPQDQALRAKAQQVAKLAKLTKDAHFNVIIKLTTNSENRRQQEQVTIGEMMTANPGLITWFGDLYFKNSDGPGHQQMADRARVMLAPPIQAMLKAQEQGKPFDPQAQAEIAQLQQRIQMAEQVIGELKQMADDNAAKLKIEDMKRRSDVALAQVEADKEIKLQEMKDATSLAVARINAESKGVISQMTAQEESIALAQQHAFDANQADMQRQHEAEQVRKQAEFGLLQAEQGQEHAIESGEAGHRQVMEQGEAGHAQAMQQAEQQAALAPQPEAAEQATGTLRQRLIWIWKGQQ